MKSGSVKMKPSLIGLIVLSAVFSGRGTISATITVIPSVVVALINDSTFFNCSTTSANVEWLFGSDQYSEPIIYSHGAVTPPYVDRFRVQNYANSFGNHSNLIFQYVTSIDACLYICRDRISQGMVHLTVLETQPVCESNLNVNGLIGPNSCSIKPDTVQLSCSVRYIGNQVPELQWTRMGENMTIISSICSASGNVYTCNITMETDLRMEGDSYTCQTTQSTARQYNCTSGAFRIIYVFKESEPTELTKTVGEKVHCSVNSSSQSCDLSWIFYNGTTNWTESHEPIIEFKRPGRFICRANCIMRNDSCTFTAMTVNVSVNASPQDNDNTTTTILIIVGIVIVVAVILGICLIIFYKLMWKKKRPNRPAHEPAEASVLPKVALTKAHDSAGVSLISDNEHTRGNNNLRRIKSKKAKNRGKRVKGLTILNDELFVAFEISAVIEMFKIDLSASSRSAKVNKLNDPGAMAACAKNKCLYIVDKTKNDGKQIIRFYPNGEVISAWETDDDDKGRISINRDGNIVMTVYDKHKLKIYSPDGILMIERTINFTDIPTPDPIEFIFHAINLDDDSFILCHGIYKSEVHRVCKVDAAGNLLQSFGSTKGSDDAHLSSPAYVAKRNDGTILVADQKNHRIILLSSELKFEAVLFTKENDKVSFPTTMCVYEKTGSSLSHLFLGCNKTTNSGGYVLVLRLGQ